MTGSDERRPVALEQQQRSMARLVKAVSELSLARTLEDIAAVVRTAAREINRADGATFVLRDKGECHYLDEDALSPLWKGRRFPLDSCISGWAMLNKQAVAIADIYQDARIPADAYRPTFVKSLVMVPVRQDAPVAAIGNYWAHHHEATPEEVALIQALADATSVQMENVAVYQDLEDRVRQRTAALEAANRELEAFSYSVAHDIRTPVSQLMGFAYLLEEQLAGALPGPTPPFLASIFRVGGRITKLIDDLLRLSQVEVGDFRRSNVDLTQLAKEARAALETPDPGRRVEWSIAEGMVACADGGLMAIVLENLLSNALKYSSKQPDARIEVGVRDLGAGARARTFFVRDTGAGFDPRTAQRLFTPFGRLHSQSEFRGSGIGLATCLRIIRRHGGDIWAESEPGAGATFHFTLPACES
jgi:signal transduction histidine kinase